MRVSVFSIALLTATVECAGHVRLPPTTGEQASGFGYVPVDGLAVHEAADYSTCTPGDSNLRARLMPLVDVLPDVSVRFAVASLSAQGALSFGPAQVTAANSTYRAILDVVNVDVASVDFYIRKITKSNKAVGALQHVEADSLERYEAQLRPTRVSTDTSDARARSEAFDLVAVPIYVGIGMRLSADIRAFQSGVALTSLGAIGASAQARALSGTLTVQTLGISGRAIGSSLPLPSSLDQTTIENAILALGSSRSLVYSVDSGRTDIVTTPRIVGLYSPIGSDPRLINVIYSELSREPPIWYHRCKPSR